MEDFLERYISKVEFHKQMMDSFLEQYRAHKEKENAAAELAAIAFARKEAEEEHWSAPLLKFVQGENAT